MWCSADTSQGRGGTSTHAHAQKRATTAQVPSAIQIRSDHYNCSLSLRVALNAVSQLSPRIRARFSLADVTMPSASCSRSDAWLRLRLIHHALQSWADPDAAAVSPRDEPVLLHREMKRRNQRQTRWWKQRPKRKTHIFDTNPPPTKQL